MKAVPSAALPEYTVCKPDFEAFEARRKDLQGLSGMWKRYKATGKLSSLFFGNAKYAASVALVGEAP